MDDVVLICTALLDVVELADEVRKGKAILQYFLCPLLDGLHFPGFELWRHVWWVVEIGYELVESVSFFSFPVIPFSDALTEAFATASSSLSVYPATPFVDTKALSAVVWIAGASVVTCGFLAESSIVLGAQAKASEDFIYDVDIVAIIALLSVVDGVVI